MLAAVGRWPRGSWSHSLTIDGYERPVTISARLTIRLTGVEVDLAGTSPVSAFAINVPKAYTDAYTTFGVRCLTGPAIPNNAASLSTVRETAPEGCILNAPFPLAVAARSVVGQMLPDVVFGCLAQARPDAVPAEGTSCLWNVRLSGGQTLRGIEAAEVAGKTRFTVTTFNTGGNGARPTRDGLSVTAFPSGIRNVSIEVIETISPVRWRRKEYRVDSGGPGRFRGGLGQVLEFESAEAAPMILGVAFDRIDHPARGWAGGQPGAPGRVRLGSGAVLAGQGRRPCPPANACSSRRRAVEAWATPARATPL